jgi:serine/threonine protein kinase
VSPPAEPARKLEERVNFNVSEDFQSDKILTAEEVALIEKEKYILGEYVNSGNTRDVFRAIFVKNGLRLPRVIKIAKRKKDINLDSVCTLMNLSRLPEGNPNVNELEAQNSIGDHPHIASVTDSFYVNERHVVVEEYGDGPDIQRDVEKRLKVNDLYSKEKFMDIFNQCLDLMKDMYSGQDYRLHRDIKPSNIIINKLGRVVFTDFQNAKKGDNIEFQLWPTRGGTPYTSPDLLNSLFTGEEAHASRQTEFYALANTMYFALTGKEAFNYKIKFDPANGNPLEIGDKTFKVSLFDGENKVDEITSEIHRSNKKKALKKLSKYYQKLFSKALSFDDTFLDVDEFREELKQTDKRYKFNLAVKKYTKPALWILGLGIPLYLVLKFATPVELKEYDYSPTLNDLLRTKTRIVSEVNVGPQVIAGGIHIPLDMATDLKPYLEDVKKALIDPKFIEYSKLSDFISSRSIPNVNIGNELNAIIFSAYNFSQKKKVNLFGFKRSKNFLVPIDFVKARLYRENNGDNMHLNMQLYKELNDNRMEIVNVKDYLVMSTNFIDLKDGFLRVEDVFAKYFCSDEEIMFAKQRSDNQNYFPVFKENEDDKTTSRYDGYSTHLTSKKKELINRALAFYLTVDDEGNYKQLIEPDSTKVYDYTVKETQKKSMDAQFYAADNNLRRKLGIRKF